MAIDGSLEMTLYCLEACSIYLAAFLAAWADGESPFFNRSSVTIPDYQSPIRGKVVMGD
jgi:hypothetical protein